MPLWTQVLRVRDELTGLFLAREGDGACVGVSRLNSSLGVWQLEVEEGRQRLREFEIEEFPLTPYRVEEDAPYDIRRRPWYALAKSLNGPAWADSYLFLGLKGNRDEMGVTYAEPIRDADGSLTGVIAADFSLRQLSGFLKTLRVGHSGYAFVVELRDDGSRGRDRPPGPRQSDASDRRWRPFADPGRRVPRPAGRPRRAGSGPGVGSPGLGTSLRFEENGVRHVGLARRIKGTGFPPWQIVIVLPEKDVFAHVDEITAIVRDPGGGERGDRGPVRDLSLDADRAAAGAARRRDRGGRGGSISRNERCRNRWCWKWTGCRTRPAT